MSLTVVGWRKQTLSAHWRGQRLFNFGQPTLSRRLDEEKESRLSMMKPAHKEREAHCLCAATNEDVWRRQTAHDDGLAHSRWLAGENMNSVCPGGKR